MQIIISLLELLIEYQDITPEHFPPQEDASTWNVVGIIGGVATLIGALSWIGNTVTQNRKNKMDNALEFAKISDKNESAKIEELTELIKKLRHNVSQLRETIDAQKESYEKIISDNRKRHQDEIQMSRELMQKTERQLSSINVAFDLVYLSLKDILGDSPRELSLMAELRKYIKSGTGNLTSSP